MKKIKYLAALSLLITLANGNLYAQVQNIPEGKMIFSNNCASCHSINRQVVGPALRDVDTRHSEQWIINFVRSSQSVIKSGDTAAVALFSRFNQVVMPDHPNLQANQVRNIIAFIREQSQMPAPVANSAVQSFNRPYKNKNNILDNLVYLNFKGEHRPIRINDFLSWFIIGMIVVLLVVVLYFAALVNNLADKYKAEKNAGTYKINHTLQRHSSRPKQMIES